MRRSVRLPCKTIHNNPAVLEGALSNSLLIYCKTFHYRRVSVTQTWQTEAPVKGVRSQISCRWSLSKTSHLLCQLFSPKRVLKQTVQKLAEQPKLALKRRLLPNWYHLSKLKLYKMWYHTWCDAQQTSSPLNEFQKSLHKFPLRVLDEPAEYESG